jgi:hypothetical protein
MANNFDAKDFTAGTAKTFKSTDNTGVHTPHHNVDTATLALPADMVRGVASVTSTTSTSLLAAAGSGVKNYVSAVQAANKGATAVLVTLQDGSGGTALGYLYVPAGSTVTVEYPVPLATSANTALYFAADGATTTLYMSAQGYKAA